MPPATPSWVKGKNLDLFIESYSSAAHVVQVRGFSETEQITHDHTTNSDRSLATSTININDFPSHLTVRTAATSVKRGQCFVKVSVRAEGVVIALLSAGYVTDAGTLAYPNGKVESSIEGPGLIRSITGANPAAGAEISETVPTGARWRFVSLLASLTTSATITPRSVNLTLDDGASAYSRLSTTGTHNQGTTRQYCFGTGGGFPDSLQIVDQGRIPCDLYLAAGHRIATVTTNLQVGDDYAAPQMLIEEWIQP